MLFRSPTIGAPSPRYYHSAVWTGTEMIAWGGRTSYYSPLGDGARYNPASNAWTAVTAYAAPTARYGNTAVWSGTEMIVWGGYNGTSYPTTAGRYNSSSDSWQAITGTGAPPLRSYHTAVWTGAEMLISGGYNGTSSNINYDDNYAYIPPVTMFLYMKP